MIAIAERTSKYVPASRPRIDRCPAFAELLTDLPRVATTVGRSVVTGVVRSMPAATVELIRRPSARPNPAWDSVRLKLGAILRRGGIPARVQTFALVDNPMLQFVNAADSLVLQQLYWFGERGWEPELLPWWRLLCARSSVILELGANVGYYAVQGATAAPGARYIAVEPHPTSVDVCRRNLAINDITSVRVLQAAAVADGAETSVRLLVPWEQLATPTVAFLPAGSELPAAMARREAAGIDVPTVDIRQVVADVDLIKIDTEGQEYELLNACRDHLRAHRPAIVVEVLPGTPRLRSLLTSLCEDLGYRCHAVSRDRLFPLPTWRIANVELQREYGINDVILSTDPELQRHRDSHER